jgi:ATP-dependent Lhr-like helicase
LAPGLGLGLEAVKQAVVESFKRAGWSRLTPIQEKALPVLIRRRNALLVAPTGSGKTEAAVLPIFTLEGRAEAAPKGVRVLYITPLRALNRDIFRRILAYAEAAGLRAEVRHGDTPSSARQRMVAHPPEVLITTPETLAILLVSPKMRLHLRSVRWVVVDELHELLGSERGTHLALSLERLCRIAQGRVVRVGLSATLGDLGKAARFLTGQGRCAVLVDPTARGYRVRCEYVEGGLPALAERVAALARQHRTTILFTNTRDEAEYLAAILKAKAPDLGTEVHHGSLSREAREEAEARMREGALKLVVATSSLELGIDIGSVDLVLQVGSPRQAVKLVQRVGRSRHQVGEAAVGLILATRLDDEIESWALIRMAQQGRLEPPTLHHNALDVVAHHLAGLALEVRAYRVEEALRLFRQAYPFQDLGLEELDSCLRVLEGQGVVRYDGEVVRARGARTYTYYYDNISTIPDVVQFDVVDTTTKRSVGRLDQLFVGEYGEPGKAFTLKGRAWRIVGVDDAKRVVHVEPLTRPLATIPYWVGELIPVDYQAAQEVGRLRHQVLQGRLPASRQLFKALEEARKAFGLLPDHRVWVVEEARGSLVLHSCLGSQVNGALAIILSTLLSSRTGYLVEARSDPYRVLLGSKGPLGGELLVEVLNGAFDVEAVLALGSAETHPFTWRIWHAAKRFGVVERGAQYDRRAAQLLRSRFQGTALYAEALRELFTEKYDLSRLLEVLDALRQGRIRVVVRKLSAFTPLAAPIVELASSLVAMPLSLEASIVALVKERLAKARHRLICLSCGRWDHITTVDRAREPVRCPRCGSRLVGRTYPGDDGLAKLVAKRLKGRSLTKEERAAFNRAWKAASLLQTFGRRALLALGGYGVGVDTAARLLRDAVDLEDLYRRIYRAEKTYIATRGFWED